MHEQLVHRRGVDALPELAAHGGTTVLVTTHYMDEAEYCNRVSIMVDGRIAALGTPAEVKASHGVTTMDELFVHLTRPRAVEAT